VRHSVLAAGVIALSMLGGQARTLAQQLVELRLADTRYRYVDWNYTWKSAAVVDVFYIGVPGSNELNVGGGYAIRSGRLVLTPLVYAVIGKEDSQRGVKVAVLASFEKDGWKLLSFLGAYARASGAVRPYQVLDTLDVTRTFAARWEAGVQSGFFRTGGAWNPQVGPLLKLNDGHGAWAISYRFGPQREFRVGRVLTF
jgi:hypothetical protein